MEEKLFKGKRLLRWMSMFFVMVALMFQLAGCGGGGSSSSTSSGGTVASSGGTIQGSGQ